VLVCYTIRRRKKELGGCMNRGHWKVRAGKVPGARTIRHRNSELADRTIRRRNSETVEELAG
jgi:hypothetical protein